MTVSHRIPFRVGAVVVAAAIGLFAGCYTGSSITVEVAPPPETKVDPVVDVVHGVELTDPYRWLEDDNSTDTRDWIDRQNAFTDSIFQQISGRDAIREKVSKLFEFESVGSPTEAGGRYFYTRRAPGQDLDMLYVRDGLDGEERLLLDPHSMSEDHTVSVHLQDVSADGKLLAYLVRAGGADEAQVRILDVDAGKDLEDALPLGLYLAVDMRPDGKGFYYATFGAQGPRIMYHAMGTDPSTDTMAFDEDVTFQELALPEVSDDGRWLLVNVLQGTSGPTRIFLKDLENDGPFQKVAGDGKSHAYATIAGDHILITTDEDAPNRRVMLADVNEPGRESWTELIPEREEAVVEFASGLGGRVLLSYMKDVQPRFALYELDGTKFREIEFPTIGAVFAGSGRWDSNEVFLLFSSFHVPSTVYRVSTETGEAEVWAQAKIPIDVDAIEVKQVFFDSKDGTRVPMFVVHRKDIELNGDHPALLTGYGGFSLSLTPSFFPMGAALVESGGVFASANLRGGGEFGEAWHEAGMFANKQNTFDDFAAAAEFLAAEGYTRSDRLAVMGGSNGGLTAGALLTQRPDLMSAVICTVPVLDMVRYHQFLLGRYWVSEYGSSEDAEQFKYLLEYSPYHNVEENAQFPATLFITGDMDTRVDPLHARKMTALVQARNGSDEPIMLRYNVRTGHAAAPPLREIIDEHVDIAAFLAWQVGMEI